jgi:ABC-type transporter Mla subunit MlaD
MGKTNDEQLKEQRKELRDALKDTHKTAKTLNGRLSSTTGKVEEVGKEAEKFQATLSDAAEKANRVETTARVFDGKLTEAANDLNGKLEEATNGLRDKLTTAAGDAEAIVDAVKASRDKLTAAANEAEAAGSSAKDYEDKLTTAATKTESAGNAAEGLKTKAQSAEMAIDALITALNTCKPKIDEAAAAAEQVVVLRQKVEEASHAVEQIAANLGDEEVKHNKEALAELLQRAKRSQRDILRMPLLLAAIAFSALAIGLLVYTLIAHLFEKDWRLGAGVIAVIAIFLIGAIVLFCKATRLKERKLDREDLLAEDEIKEKTYQRIMDAAKYIEEKYGTNSEGGKFAAMTLKMLAEKEIADRYNG